MINFFRFRWIYKLQMLELDFVDFSPVSFNKAMNHNRFAKEIEIILSGCKYHLCDNQPKV